jgi:hypothetical protein
MQPKAHGYKHLIASNIWGVLIGVSSTKKSPCITVGVSLLEYALEKVVGPRNQLAQKEYTAQAKLFKAERNLLEEALKSAMKKGETSKAKELADKIASLEAPTLDIRDPIINDATQEALGLKLSKNSNGVFQIRDELSGLLASLNKPNQDHARAFYLESYNSATNYSVERIVSESYVIKHHHMTMLGGIQPSMFSPVLKERQTGINNDGLVERLIQFAVFPDFDGASYVDEQFDDSYETRAKRLFENAVRLERSDDPLILTFSNDAQKKYKAWVTKHIEKVNKMTESTQSIYGKQAAFLSKLVLSFHMIKELDKEEVDYGNISTVVDIETLEMAILWIDFLDHHINRIVNYTQQDTELHPARELLARMDKLPDSFTVRDINRKNWAFLKDEKVRDKALAMLVEHYYLDLHEQPSGTRIKRTYTKHPSVRS